MTCVQNLTDLRDPLTACFQNFSSRSNNPLLPKQAFLLRMSIIAYKMNSLSCNCVACENIRGEERGETDVFAGYQLCHLTSEQNSWIYKRNRVTELSFGLTA